MATIKRNTQKKENKGPQRIDHQYSVGRVKEFDNGGIVFDHQYSVGRVKEFDNGGIVFDLTIDDITVYGCRVASGTHGDFVSWPSRKGKDDKYYSIVYLRLTEDETNEILDKVSAALAEQ